jgi:hypothetical protein
MSEYDMEEPADLIDHNQQYGGETLKETDILFPVSILNIQLDTNVDGVKQFKRGMIKTPKTSRVPILTSDSPFFTRHVKYPFWIERASWQTRYEFFFNRDVFIDTLRKEIVKQPKIWDNYNLKTDSDRLRRLFSSLKKEVKKLNALSAKKMVTLPPEWDDFAKKITDKTDVETIDLAEVESNNEKLKKILEEKSKEKPEETLTKVITLLTEIVESRKGPDTSAQYKEYEIRNVMITLRSIFPIPEAFGTTLENTYEHILNGNSNIRVALDVNVKNAINIFGFMYKFGIVDKAKEDFFINISGKRYSIERVIWENDVVNHPEYFKFLEAHHETFEEVEKSKEDVETKYKGYINDLNKPLDEMAAVDNLKLKFYEIIRNQDHLKKLFEIDFTKEDDDVRKNVKISKKLKSLQTIGIINIINQKLLQTPIEDPRDGKDFLKDGEIKIWASIVKLIYESNNITVEIEPTDNDKTRITKFRSFLAPEPGIMISEFVKKLAIENSPFSIFLNLVSNVPTDERNRDRAQVNERMQEKLKRLFGDSRETADAAAKTILAIKEDADSHEETKREPITVFFTGDYNKYFVDLLKLAVQVNATSVVRKFANEGVPMILTDKQLDGSEERPIIKRRNKFIRENFGTEASISNKLAVGVNNVYEPVRKTSNAKLYKLIKQLKSDIPISPYLSKADLNQIEQERQVFQQIYAKYISRYASTVSISDIEPYLYTGVEEAKIIPSKTKENEKDSEISRNVQEIYVRVNLVEALKMETTPNAQCKYYDKMLENEYLYLTDKRNKDLSRLNKYRDFVFDRPNPLSELAIIAAEEVKNSLEESAEKKLAGKEQLDNQQKNQPKKTERREGGNRRHSRKIRPASYNKTLSVSRQ